MTSKVNILSTGRAGGRAKRRPQRGPVLTEFSQEVGTGGGSVGSNPTPLCVCLKCALDRKNIYENSKCLQKS